MTRNCAQAGHIWIEADGTVFHRTRDLSNHDAIPVHCKHCEATVEMVGYGARRA